MKRLLIILAAVLCYSIPGMAQGGLFSYNGDCSVGGQEPVVQGLQASGTSPIGGGSLSLGSGVIASYPQCSVAVYFTGTVTKASIFSNNLSTPTPLSNPFTANSDGSFLFFVSALCYDIVETTGSGPTMPSSRTITSICPGVTAVPPVTSVTFSSTPTFAAIPFATYSMTLAGNVTLSTITGSTNGEQINFLLCQDATGGRTFAWPTSFLRPPPPSPGPNACSDYSFVYDGTNWRQVSSGDAATFNSLLLPASSPTSPTLAAITVGNLGINNSSDSQVLVSRLADNTISGNGHAFSDSTEVIRTNGGPIGYASYDQRGSSQGTGAFDHVIGFQAAWTYNFSGTLNNSYGFGSIPTLTSGAITNAYGGYAQDFQGVGGSITNNYGFYVGPLTRGTTNFAFYSAGNKTPSQFGSLLSTELDPMVTVSRPLDDSGSGNAHAFVDSSQISRSVGGPIGYNSFDCRGTYTGTANFDHNACVQAAFDFQGSGTISRYFAFLDLPEIDSGTIRSMAGFQKFDTTGLGTVQHQFGALINTLTKGTVDNWAFGALHTTFDDTWTNYEILRMGWVNSTDTATIETAQNGTGLPRALKIGTSGNNTLSFYSNGVTRLSFSGAGLATLNSVNLPSAGGISLLNTQGPLSPVTGNGAAQTLYTFTIPANTIGAGKGLHIRVFWKHTTGTASVIYRVLLGGNQISNLTSSGTAQEYADVFIFNNAGVQNTQYSACSALINAVVISGCLAPPATNLALAQTVLFDFNVANTDAVTPEMWSVEVIQ